MTALDLHCVVRATQTLVLLFELKRFLKLAYSLSDAKCQKFNPNEPYKGPDKYISNAPTRLPGFPRPPADTVALFRAPPPRDKDVAQAYKEYRAPLKAFKRMMEDDPDDVAGVAMAQAPSTASASAKKRNRRSSATKPSKSQRPEELIGDDAHEDEGL
jgi:hypothetical protein